MYEEIIISGFGGQGVLFAGQLLAYAALGMGKHVTWIPSYGPEVRGGTAHCTVVIGDDPIGSPVVRRPSIAIVMNPPSMEKYAPLVKPGGVLIVNSSLVPAVSGRTDIREIRIPASDIADELGSSRLANVVLLGALLGATGLLSLEAVDAALDEHMSERQRTLLEANKHALRRGAALGMPTAAEQTTGDV